LAEAPEDTLSSPELHLCDKFERTKEGKFWNCGRIREKREIGKSKMASGNREGRRKRN